jgi:branched-subunit amino acid aminotransferase/4-amino-4-deoxychorismate lyase
MIWVDGKVVPDHELKISALDRTFEHGLGLFETLRTYDGQAPLLYRHLERLLKSAEALGLATASVELPGPKDIEALIEQEGIGPDVMLRIVLTGGVRELGGGTLFMRALPLPAEIRREGAIVELGSWLVLAEDVMARHKSLNYWARRIAFERAKSMGFDEVLSIATDPKYEYRWTIGEGSRTNLFAIIKDQLVTPDLDGPIVPGIMRRLVLQRHEELRVATTQERPLELSELLNGASEVFLTNSVRGIIPVSRVILTTTSQSCQWPAPGPWTQRLSLMVSDWLGNGSATT